MNKSKALILSACIAFNYIFLSCQSIDLTIVPTSPPATVSSTPISIDEARFLKALENKDYLKECRNKYPPVYTEPVGYKNIFPGITTAQDLLNLLGKPEDLNSYNDLGFDEWIYGIADEELYFFVYTKNSIVDGVSLISDEDYYIPLQDILKTYGCPELIAADVNEPDYSSEIFSTPFATTYELVRLEYINAGLSFIFHRYPLSLSEIPGYVNVVTTEQIIDMYKNVHYFYPNPVELEDVVR